MKNILLLLIALTAVSCRAQTIRFTWDAYPQPVAHGLVGYNFYRGDAGTTNWSAPVVLGTNTVYAIPFVASAFGDRFFITARNNQGLESPPSNVWTNTIPRSPENFNAIHNIKLP